MPNDSPNKLRATHQRALRPRNNGPAPANSLSDYLPQHNARQLHLLVAGTPSALSRLVWGGAQETGGVMHCDDFDRLRSQPIHDSVRWMDNLPTALSRKFWNDTAGTRKLRKPLDGVHYPRDREPGHRPKRFLTSLWGVT